MKKAIFLDRDGVINKNPKKHDYVKNLAQFIWLPDAKEAIRLINQKNFLAIVISNQRGVVRGLMTTRDVEDIHQKIQRELKKISAKLDGIYWCGHDYPDNCNCRKPKPGLILQAAKEHKIDLANSWMIGDKDSDIEAGKNAGCKTLKIETNSSLFKALEYLFEQKVD